MNTNYTDFNYLDFIDSYFIGVEFEKNNDKEA